MAWGRTRTLDQIRRELTKAGIPLHGNGPDVNYGQLLTDIRRERDLTAEDEERRQERNAFWLNREQEDVASDNDRERQRNLYWTEREERHQAEDQARPGVIDQQRIARETRHTEEDAAFTTEKTNFWTARAARHQ